MTEKVQKAAIYLDNQASTPISSRVLQAMKPHLEGGYGNPHSSDHWFGWQAKKSIEVARRQVAELINADTDEIFFTSGATEANNLAILGSLDYMRKHRKHTIVVSEIEHKCVLECANEAEVRGFNVARIKPTTAGQITTSELEKVIDKTVGLVSVMTVNNEIGAIQPIKELATVARRYNALFHTDAAQAGMFLNLDVRETEIDLLSLSGHKLHAPKGIGAIYIRRDIQNKIRPIIFGGGQENGFRSGTLPTMLCVGFGEACAIAREQRADNERILSELSQIFLTLLRARLPEIRVNGGVESRHPGNLNIQFANIDAHSLLQSLQPMIAASTGSACTTGTPEPSYVLRAIGLTNDEAKSSLRFSVGIQNTSEEMEKAADKVAQSVLELRDEFPLQKHRA